METKIAIFKGKQIRKILRENEWWFSVSGAYWRKLKQRLKEEGSEAVTFDMLTKVRKYV